MNNKNKKINLTLTVFGLLGTCGISNAQQVKQESKPEAPKQETKKAEVKVEVKAATPVVAASGAKVEVKAATPVATVPGAKVEVKPSTPVATVPGAKVEVKTDAKSPSITPVAVGAVVGVAAATASSAPTTTSTTTSTTTTTTTTAAPAPATPASAPVAAEPKKTESKKSDLPKIQATRAFAERAQLVEKYGKGKGLIVGLFPGSNAVVDTTSYLARYLPFANYMTNGAGELISFVPEISVATLKDKAAKREYDLMYINAETAVVAVANGYEPLGQRTDKIISVILTKKSTNITKIQELPSLKVGAIPQAMVSTLAKAKFKKENVNVSLISGGLTGQQELVLGLDNGSLDAIVMREENASALISKNPDRYKIAIVLDEAPGFILLAKKELSTTLKDNLSKSLLALNIDNPADKYVLDGMDAKSSSGAFMKMDLKEIESFDNKIKIVE